MKQDTQDVIDGIGALILFIFVIILVIGGVIMGVQKWMNKNEPEQKQKSASLVYPDIKVMGNSIVVHNFPDPDKPEENEKFDFKKLNELVYKELVSGKFSVNEVQLSAYFEYTNSYGYKETYWIHREYPYLVDAAKKYKDFYYWNKEWGWESRMVRVPQ